MTATFTRRQIVRNKRFVGPTFEPDWSEKAVIVGMHPRGTVTSRPDDEWFIVRYDDGRMLSAHATSLMASNEPPYKGRLPTYAQATR